MTSKFILVPAASFSKGKLNLSDFDKKMLKIILSSKSENDKTSELKSEFSTIINLQNDNAQQIIEYLPKNFKTKAKLLIHSMGKKLIVDKNGFAIFGDYRGSSL